jgi:predicted ATP-grasp superfamily ATP-dependent carboligase
VRAFDYTSGGRTALQFEERAGTFLKSNFKIHNNEDRKMAHIPPEGKFYMLVTDKGSPIVSHIDKEEARTEAQRLIRNGVDRVVLLEATEVIKPLTRTETTTLG